LENALCYEYKPTIVPCQYPLIKKRLNRHLKNQTKITMLLAVFELSIEQNKNSGI